MFSNYFTFKCSIYVVRAYEIYIQITLVNAHNASTYTYRLCNSVVAFSQFAHTQHTSKHSFRTIGHNQNRQPNRIIRLHIQRSISPRIFWIYNFRTVLYVFKMYYPIINIFSKVNYEFFVCLRTRVWQYIPILYWINIFQVSKILNISMISKLFNTFIRNIIFRGEYVFLGQLLIIKTSSGKIREIVHVLSYTTNCSLRHKYSIFWPRKCTRVTLVILCKECRTTWSSYSDSTTFHSKTTLRITR